MAAIASPQRNSSDSAKRGEVVSIHLVSSTTDATLVASACAEEFRASTTSLPICDPPGRFAPDMTDGYPRLAQEMAKIPERMILRRFGTLNAQNLLYYQAELTELESEWRQLEKENCDHEVSTRRPMRSSTNWWTLAEWDGRTEGEQRQWRLFQKIRSVAEKYNDALIQQMKITKLADPGDCDLRHVQNFTSNPAYMSPLTGLDGDIWGTERFPEGRSPDLFTVRARHDEDIFSKWFTDSFMAFFFKHKGDQYVSRSSLYGEVVFNERRLLRGAFIVVSILTSQLPIISIVVLYFVENPLVRLGIISGFAFLVTLCLILFTKARAVDIFLVAAAFAAIQVIFIGGNEGSTNDQ